MTDEQRRVVVADACVLINLIHVCRLDLCGRFRNEALVRIGEERLLGTIEIYTTALRAGLLTIEQADADKAILDERRFNMPFETFREILPDAGA